MPKHHRQCSFCSNNTGSNPEVVIFCANDNMKCLLNVPKESNCYICEQHFDRSDLRPHSNTKRLRDGATSCFPAKGSCLVGPQLCANCTTRHGRESFYTYLARV